MSALDYLFDEVAHHAVLRSHATLVKDARAELAQLREVSERRREDLEMAVGKWQQLRTELSEKDAALDEYRRRDEDFSKYFNTMAGQWTVRANERIG